MAMCYMYINIKFHINFLLHCYKMPPKPYNIRLSACNGPVTILRPLKLGKPYNTRLSAL